MEFAPVHAAGHRLLFQAVPGCKASPGGFPFDSAARARRLEAGFDAAIAIERAMKASDAEITEELVKNVLKNS
jgi:hypothetical protein